MKNTNLWTMGLGALCLLAVTACADRMSRRDDNNAYVPGNSSSMMAGPNTQQAQASYGVVQAIDQLQRQDVSAMGATGAAAAGGAMGATGAPTDKVYRITLRMDDGSSQMLVEESRPGYKIGDRIRYSNGAVTPY